MNHISNIDVCFAQLDLDDFLVGVTEPASGGGVSWEACLLHLCNTFGLCAAVGFKDSNGFLWRLHRRIVRGAIDMERGSNEGIGDVAEVDASYKLAWFHVHQEAPQGLAFALRPEIPQRIDNGAGRKMNGAFLGPNL